MSSSEPHILFHTPQPLETLNSGSSVRPKRILKGFKDLGYNVDTVVGDVENRRQKVKYLKQKNYKYQFCYSEPTTWPLHPIDYKFYWFLKSNKIPTGIFYRDVYWKFPNLFDHSGLKYWSLQLRYRLDLILMHYIADTIYVPSYSFGEYLDIPTTTLPPGGVDRTAKNNSSSLQRLIYVGGLSERYGSELLSQACEIAAAEQDITLDLITRESDFQSLSSKVQQRLRSDWVTVHHTSGDGLKPLYERADAGIIPRVPTEYNNIAIPVKLFEYISYGIPIISTKIDEVADFIQSTNCGLVCEADSKELARAITTLSQNSELYLRKKENAVQALKQNRWVDRAEKVASDLM